MNDTAFSNKPGRKGIARIIAATGYSMAGLRAAWVNEAAFREECLLALVMIPAAFWLGRDSTDVILLVCSCLVVLIVELLNSAIEAVVDRISPEKHELSGRAKDIGSAAVFVALAQVLFIWGMIAWERLQ